MTCELQEMYHRKTVAYLRCAVVEGTVTGLTSDGYRRTLRLGGSGAEVAWIIREPVIAPAATTP